MDDISRIYQTGRVSPKKSKSRFFDKKKHKKKKTWHRAGRHLGKLTAIVDETHKELKESNSPFRLRVHQEDDDIFIDIVTIDKAGNVSQVFKHDISDDELSALIQHIKTGRGLLLDSDA